MEIWQIVGLALIVAVISVVLKQFRKEIALQLTILTGAIIFILILGKIKIIIDCFKTLRTRLILVPIIC